MNKQLVWNGLVWASAIGAAWAGRKAATALWAQMTDTEGPVNPADDDVTWREALGWAVLAGLTAAVARVLARRGAVEAWQRITGESPPGVETA